MDRRIGRIFRIQTHCTVIGFFPLAMLKIEVQNNGRLLDFRMRSKNMPKNNWIYRLRTDCFYSTASSGSMALTVIVTGTFFLTRIF